jgi:hypothetical protein
MARLASSVRGLNEQRRQVEGKSQSWWHARMMARQRVSFPLPLVFQRQHSPEDSASWHPNGYSGVIDRHQNATDKAQGDRMPQRRP